MTSLNCRVSIASSNLADPAYKQPFSTVHWQTWTTAAGYPEGDVFPCLTWEGLLHLGLCFDIFTLQCHQQ